MSDLGPRGDYGRIRQRPYQKPGYDRERRLQTTMAAGAIALLLIGLVIGFSVGRATAPRAVVPAPPATPVTETTTPVDSTGASGSDQTSDTAVTDLTGETSQSAETTLADTMAPPKPKQLSPANGAVIGASRVNLRWSKVSDDSGNPVTYAFEIQNRNSSGSYGNGQVIKGLQQNSYSARVLTVRRRWRVWAVDEAGNASAKSPWHTYIRRYVAPKKSKDTSSTETSKTH